MKSSRGLSPNSKMSSIVKWIESLTMGGLTRRQQSSQYISLHIVDIIYCCWDSVLCSLALLRGRCKLKIGALSPYLCLQKKELSFVRIIWGSCPCFTWSTFTSHFSFWYLAAKFSPETYPKNFFWTGKVWPCHLIQVQHCCSEGFVQV